VLDVGCNEGMGTYLLAKECGFAQGVDFDEEAIVAAKHNFEQEQCTFGVEDILQTQGKEEWDAIVNFDVIEHIVPEEASAFLQSICNHLKPEGLVIVGTPSLISQQFASAFSKKGHINIYSPERLREEMQHHFHHVFIFSANDEIVHTGYLPLAHYLIAVCSEKK
jgi:2-polyprenyl-3-methyl-5-hydroxy-6-metoxy-1,4-benzoquinol methylase